MTIISHNIQNDTLQQPEGWLLLTRFVFFFYCATTRQTEGLDFVQLPKWTAHLPDKYTNNDKWYTFLSFAPKLKFHPRWSLNHLTINSTIKSTNMMVWLKDLIHRFKSIHRKAPPKAVNLHSMHLSICLRFLSNFRLISINDNQTNVFFMQT